MTDQQRLSALFQNLYNGHPWIDVTLSGVLENIPAEKALQRVGSCNTIWEIVNHLIRWRENVLQRVQGSVLKTPANNYIVPVTDTSGIAWESTLRELTESQSAWMDFLKNLDLSQLDNAYPVNGLTYYEHIHGILQHDAYHLGQIVLLAKLLQ
ncbi:MAG TPA: DinB family protein [Saprospiraceae bacterium]|nr:DinB family protein [Saprospiraceae bacterium]